jgi:pSer/pThr/pTyr-binding forkhead associated (FHA) protein
VSRQPVALLTVLDDGSRDEGETIRIRSPRFTIGREKGDLTIPFDSDISGSHAELRCQKQKGRYRWFLVDGGSTNGTFLRTYRASLSREMEITLGSRRYLFQLPDHGDQMEETQALQTQTYQAPSRAMMEQLLPRLVEAGMTSKEARSFSISGETLVGGAPTCQIVIDNDPFLSPIHARFYQDETGRWMIEDRKSHNGIWIRVKRMALDKPAEFQLGQQRFRFQPNNA